MGDQMEMVSLNELVPADHNYRRFLKVWDFRKVDIQLRKLKKNNPHEGYGVERLFRCLLLQFMEDLSDRELERFLSENTAGKWFAGFSLMEKVPDHTVFCKFRSKMGTSLLSTLFALLRAQLKQEGYISEVFTFVDATHLVSKANLWKERDAVIAARYEKLNNETLPKVAVDQEARIGCKGANKFWYGYKKHTSVDMQSGLINKVAMTKANQTDAQGFKHVCPPQGAVYADKGYCVSTATQVARRKGVHLAAVKKNNMKGKSADLDRWYTGLRAPYERVFSKESKRVRYRGLVKNQFAAFMQAICFNLKRLLVLAPPPTPYTG